MKLEIRVPAMGESISEATIGTILKPSGTVVNVDDEILELETDKVNQVLYAQQPGVLQLNVSPADVVKIGQVIGTIDSEGAPEVQPPPKKAEAPEEMPAAVELPKSPKEFLEAARRTREAFLDDLKGAEQGPSVPVYKPTVAIPAPEPISARPETRKKMSKIRKVIANRMVEAQHTTAMLTTFNEVDMSEVIKLREKYKEVFQKEHGVKLGFMSFFVKACVSALQEMPDVNASIEGDEIVYKNYFDIGIAVGTERGVIVPVVRNCDKISYAEIESSLENFAARAREGTITADDLVGGTFTITNGGVYGSLLSTPIINPPQSAILGMHKIEKRPVVINDQVVIRPMMYLALTYDHRIIDGKEAVTFLVHVKNILEDPARLFLEV